MKYHVGDIFDLTLMKKTIQIELTFDKTEMQWHATVAGKIWATHRWETRAFVSAKTRYAQQHSASGHDFEFEMVLEWPDKMERAHELLGKSEKKLRAIQQKANEAEHEHHALIGQYIAGWRDCGMSQKLAAEYAGVVFNTANKYIAYNGTETEASLALWKRLHAKPEGVIGVPSRRTRPMHRRHVAGSDD